VINAKDISKLFEVTTNLKHNTMLKLCYGMGLRVSEVVNVKIKDIDSKNKQVFIERAKGKKDRYTNLPESILEQLRTYYKTYKPKKYLFEGQADSKYATPSIIANYKKMDSFHKDVLLIWGREDLTTPFAQIHLLNSILHTQFFPVENARHLPHLKYPGLLN